jgi:hypothetical protein
MRAFAASLDAAPPASVWASTETKAIEGAGILAARFGLPVRVLEGLGENDRSSTGYLPQDAFQAMADAFFARPDARVRGWESARAAQARMVAAVGEVLAASPPGDVAIVAHGAVGALLRCHLAARPISRAWDQPGAGYRFAIPRSAFRAAPGRPGVATEWVALPPVEVAPPPRLRAWAIPPADPARERGAAQADPRRRRNRPPETLRQTDRVGKGPLESPAPRAAPAPTE